MRRTEVVEGVDDKVEAFEKVDVELVVLDVAVQGRHVDVGVELEGRLAGDDGLWTLDVLLLEEELAVQVREVDRVEVEDEDLSALAGAEPAHDCLGACACQSHRRRCRRRGRAAGGVGVADRGS